MQIGITPTKEGFQEVIDKVNEWNKANGRATKYQMGNLADMQSALVDYIDMVGMSGYAQEEASETILGSFASMKAAASDFAISLIYENGDVGASWDNLKETVGTFVDNLKPKIQEFLEAISPIATTVAGITGAFVAFKTAASISALIGTLVASFQAYQKANEGATIAQWLMNAAMNANPIVLIVTLIGGLVAALVTLWHTNDDFKNALIGAWEAIKSAATKIFSAVANFFTETIPNAFNSVIDWFKNIGKKFANIGKNIVAGLKEGISNAWKNLKKWFTGLFDDIIGIAKKILGIASPSKVFKEIGGFTAEGFGAGFEDEFAKVKDHMEDALNFDDASVGINASIKKASSGAGFDYKNAGGGVTINQNIYSEAKTAADLAEESIFEARRATTMAAWG